VTLDAWQPQHEITHRRLVPAREALAQLGLPDDMRPVYRRIFAEAGRVRDDQEVGRFAGPRSSRSTWHGRLETALTAASASLPEPGAVCNPRSGCTPARRERRHDRGDHRPHRS
jgi:hypothetical protein